MAFRKGIDKVAEAAQRQAFTGGKNRFINWKDGDTKVIRFLVEGDEIVLTSLHEWVRCHDGKNRSFVCRREVGEECELCENPETAKKREQAVSVAVLRQETKKDGKTVFKTVTEEVEREVDGKTVTKVEPYVGIIRQSPKNFWNWFNGAFQKRGTLLDRDYSVTRVGADKNTEYNPYPEDEQEMDLSKFEEFMPDIEEFLTWQSSKEYYDRYLRGIDSKEKEEDSSDDSDLTPEDLEALKAANSEVAAAAVSGEFD